MSAIAFSVGGCRGAPILPGQSVIVVTAERELNNSLDIFQEVTEFDHQNLVLMKEKAPQVHAVIQELRVKFWPVYDSAVAAVRAYKRSQAEEDGAEAETQLSQVRELIRQARLALIQAKAAIP